MTHDVFISYSHKDKLIADGICTSLESEDIRCWIAPRDIAPGEDWPTAISDAISRSRIMVLVFSAYSNSSDDVSREIILAANHKVIIIPFKIDEVEPEPGKQYYLARTHWLDALNPPTRAQIHTLAETVKSFMPEFRDRKAVQQVPDSKLKPAISENAGGTLRVKEAEQTFIRDGGGPTLSRKGKAGIKIPLVIITICVVLLLVIIFTMSNIPPISNIFAGARSTPTASAMPPTPTNLIANFPIEAKFSNWFDTGIIIQVSDEIRIGASGSIDLGGAQSDPNGNPNVEPKGYGIVPIAQYGALVGTIGSGEPFIIGSLYQGTAKFDGNLQLLINDVPGSYDDNSGQFQVTITIIKSH